MFRLFCLGWVMWASQVMAADFRFGINAEVSYRESEAEVRQRYAPLLQELGRLTGHQFNFVPVYSDRVAQAVSGRGMDFLLIHTHAALKAEKDYKYQVVGFTQDRQNNQVYFMVQPQDPARSLADIASARIGVPGMQSWATATALGALRQVQVAQPNLVPTRYSDAVPLMVELHSAQVAVTRSKKLVDDAVTQKKMKVLHVTSALPLNALIASAAVPTPVVTKVREALTSLSNSQVFDAIAFTGLTYSAEQSRNLHEFYQP